MTAKKTVRAPAATAPKSSWFTSAVGRQFRAARERERLSADDVSRLTGGAIHARMVTQYERATTPKVDIFLILCAVYRLDPLKLFGSKLVEAVRGGQAQAAAKILNPC